MVEHHGEWKEEDERAFAASLRESHAENLSDYERRLLEKYPPEDQPLKLSAEAQKVLEQWTKARPPAKEDEDL